MAEEGATSPDRGKGWGLAEAHASPSACRNLPGLSGNSRARKETRLPVLRGPRLPARRDLAGFYCSLERLQD